MALYVIFNVGENIDREVSDYVGEITGINFLGISKIAIDGLIECLKFL